MINIYKCAYGYELIIAEKMQRNERDKKTNGKETQKYPLNPISTPISPL